jgi:cytochrome c oxidase cbb3-type subunit 3
MRALTSGTLIMVALAAGLSGCRRETRLLREPPAMRERVMAVNVNSFVPGGNSPRVSWPNPYQESAYTVAEGKRLFSWYNCVGCHAHGGGGMGPALMDSVWIYGSDPGQIYATIVQGRPNGMPSWGSRIPEYQVWELVAYVRSLAGLTGKGVAPSRSDDMSAEPVENTFPPGSGKGGTAAGQP